MVLDGWMLARVPASPAQGRHRHRPWYISPLFLHDVALRNVQLLIKNDWRGVCLLGCQERWSWVGDNNPSRSGLRLIWSEQA